MITASCHCGNITITMPDKITTVTSCNCSICSKYAALWAYFTAEEIKINAPAESLANYCWGDKMINFHHCKQCGCITHYTSTELGPAQRTAVNVRLLDGKPMSAFNIRYFDGADTWQEIKQPPF